MKATVIKSNGTTQDVELSDNTGERLNELQTLVGGYIEELTATENRLLVVNEDGKELGLPVNQAATELWLDNHGHDAVRGVAVLMDQGDDL
jgi:hypothetical protein